MIGNSDMRMQTTILADSPNPIQKPISGTNARIGIVCRTTR